MKLRIEKPVYGGAGLARAEDGKAVFVPLALPGELVSVRVEQDKRSYAEARLIEVLEASPERVAPGCPYFGVCGGCQYQHASYSSQLAMKEEVLRETLSRAGVAALPPIKVHAGDAWRDRNRIRLLVRAEDGALGYRERSSHRMLAVEQCPIAAPVLERALRAVGAALAQEQLGGVFAETELATAQGSDAVCMTLWLRAGAACQQATFEAFCRRVQATLPELRGAAVCALAPRARQGRGRPAPDDGSAGEGAVLASWGQPWLEHLVGSLTYRASLRAFFQVHRGMVEPLVELACGDEAGELAWDLYAGVGLFSRVLAQRFARVVAVEGAPVSAADLRHNLPAPHVAVEASTLAFLERERARRPIPGRRGAGREQPPPTPDFVLLDPPRAGVGEEGARVLSEIGPPHITYVSCDPATLGRDLQPLLDSGYVLQQLHLIDLFPQTFHVEAVAKLTRG